MENAHLTRRAPLVLGELQIFHCSTPPALQIRSEQQKLGNHLVDFLDNVVQTVSFHIRRLKNMEDEKSARARRGRLVAIILPASIGVLTIAVVTNLRTTAEFGDMVRWQLWDLIGYALIALSSVVVLMTYLQMGFKGFTGEKVDENLERHNERMINEFSGQLREARAQITEILGRLNEQSTRPLTEEEKAEIAAQLRTRISADTNKEVFEEFKASANKELQASLKQRDVRQMLSVSHNRLSQELKELGWRGNLNLAFGAITTVVGLSILGTSVYSEIVSNKDMWSFASHFLPRLTLVIFIEIFAYFFLSLYRSSLQEIKYFQNEMTNVESKQIALIAALNLADSAAIDKILTSLSETERNHIISKDQTTVELEKIRVDRTSNSEMLKIFTELFQRKPS
jgi:hypothetical protein